MSCTCSHVLTALACCAGGHGNTACTAYQTSTAYGGMAEKALVDLNASNWGVDQCTHTQTQTNPWWRVDFGRLVNVNAIRVFGRTDCCYDRLQGFQVRVGSNHMVPQQNPACHHESNEPMQPISEPAPQPPKFYTDVNCSSPMHGRYVYIQIPGGNRILSLCQVQVWGREYNPWIEVCYNTHMSVCFDATCLPCCLGMIRSVLSNQPLGSPLPEAATEILGLISWPV